MSYLDLARQTLTREAPATNPLAELRDQDAANRAVAPADGTPPESVPAAVMDSSRLGPWNLDETVRHIVALTESERQTYRAALAHDTAALARADAILHAATETDR